MRIALINGSPKRKNSASEVILGYLMDLLKQEHEVINIHLNSPTPGIEELGLVMGCDAAVWAFPLYVDGIPSHLIPNLLHLQELNAKEGATPTIYALVNCGFYEGEQARVALQIMKNWASRAHFKWGQGYGLGAGGMFTSLKGVPLGVGPLKNLGKELNALVVNIRTLDSGIDSFVNPNFPRLAYKLAAESSWRKQIKANGLEVKDLGRKITPNVSVYEKKD